jgi:hypothetical protein
MVTSVDWSDLCPALVGGESIVRLYESVCLVFKFPDWLVFSLVILMISCVALCGVFWLLKYWIQGSRSEAWQRIAEILGFSYRERDSGVLQPYSHFDTFSHGTERARHLLESEANGCWRCIVDYPLGGDDANKYHTICLVRSDRLALPHFNIQPATWLSRQLKKLMGKTAALPFIEHPDDAEFNSVYHLQGADATAVQSALTPEVRAFLILQRARQFCFEADGQTLLFHTRTLVRPDKAPDMLDKSLEILRVFNRNR